MKKQLLSALFVAGFAASAIAQSFMVSGPRTIYNLNAKKTGSGRSGYTFFNLTQGKEITPADSNTSNWDLAFKGTTILLNGGVSGSSTVAGQVLTGTSFKAVATAPETGYVVDGTTKAIPTGSGKGWYKYDGAGAAGTHSITPIPDRVIAIRLADGRYAKLEILNYYKGAPANIPVDVTSNVVYDENGDSTSFYSFRYLIANAGSNDLSQSVTTVTGLYAGLAKNQLFSLAAADSIAYADSVSAGWDLAFKTTTIRTNGGVSGPGAVVGQGLTTEFGNLTTAPTEDYVADGAIDLAIANWYTYTQAPYHAILPSQYTYVVKDNFSRYAKITFSNYYKGNPAIACGTSRYYTFSYYYNPYGADETKLAGRDGKDLDVASSVAYPVIPDFTVSSTADVFSPATGSTTGELTVTGNTDWLASSNNNWISIENVGNNKFKIVTAENTGEARNGTVSVTYCNGMGAAAATIKVAQAAATTTGVEDNILNNGLNIYPNPSAAAELKVAGAETIEVVISDLQGTAVFVGTLAGGDFVNTSLKSGVYVAKLVSATKSTTQKLIIQ